MMLILEEYFKNYPARKKVAEFLFENGLSVKNGKIYLKSAEIPISELSRVIGVNRKIVYHTIEYIEKTPPLKLIFENLQPFPSLVKVAPIMGWEVLELELEKHLYGPALSALIVLLTENKIPIMEIFSKNLSYEEARAYIIIDGTIPVDVFVRLKEIPGFKRLILHTPEKRKENLVCSYCEVRYCPKRVLFEKMTVQ
ncbi:hypothetical protein PAP_01585 [Palaeococcus pacificus DY20341]|uniref:Regulator of amino acid metabolism, contains ACT domain protein n=1 Tax=Palaeococcus pacificus DY20341 TaxID=1343739 RepID=A0A075LRL8_9EURY|nr:regulator of amino acid metabolism, contains ACT domain protein [Palaeococcus pacificus]AIF68756.1 hypothetical protein PAP_01585 [Palaeococcus pacificus DY20341]